MGTTKNKSALKHFPVKTHVAKLSLMKAFYCSYAIGQKEKTLAKYSKCTQIDVGSLISTLLFLIGTLINKDATHKARSNKMSQIIEISDENAWPLD